jgi:hypothetical protein
MKYSQENNIIFNLYYKLDEPLYWRLLRQSKIQLGDESYYLLKEAGFNKLTWNRLKFRLIDDL